MPSAAFRTVSTPSSAPWGIGAPSWPVSSKENSPTWSARPVSLFLKVKESVADLDHVLRRIEGLGMVLIRVELERHALRDLGRRSIGVVRENRRGGGCRALTDLVAGIARLTRRRGGRSLRGIAHLHRSRIGSVRAIGSAVWLPGPLPRLLPRLRPGALLLHLGDFLGEHRTGPTEDGLAHEQDAHQHDKRLPRSFLRPSPNTYSPVRKPQSGAISPR